MSISSQKLEVPVTYDSYTPSSSSSSSPRSSCTSINVALYHKSSEETLQSHQGSISNSSVHTFTGAIVKDPFERQDPSSSDHKSLHSVLKRGFDFRNQSLSTVCSIRDPESNRSSTATSTLPGHSFILTSLEDETESSSSLYFTPRSSLAISPALITDPSPSPSPVYAVLPSPPLDDDGDSQPSSDIEITEIFLDKNPSPDAEEKFKKTRYDVSSCYLYPIADVLPLTSEVLSDSVRPPLLTAIRLGADAVP